jgi:hypothetical protein
MRPADTSLEAHAVQLEFYRRIGPARRLELALQMSDEMRHVTADGIRSRHPEYTDEQVRYALFRLTLGDALFCAAWPDAPLLAP